jgi:hypothetical protein
VYYKVVHDPTPAYYVYSKEKTKQFGIEIKIMVYWCTQLILSVDMLVFAVLE